MNAFSGILTTTVIVLETYQIETFGNLSVTNIDECLSIFTFTDSNTLIKIYTLSYSYIMTHSISITEIVSAVISSISETVSFFVNGSNYTFVSSKLVYSDYTIIA